MPIACPNDCGAKELQEDQVEGHLAHACLNRQIVCPNNCPEGQKMLAKLLVPHLEKTCSRRLVPCRLGCGKEVVVDELVLHETNMCECRLLRCELGQCFTMVPAKDMNEHMRYSCEHRPISCPSGCGAGGLTPLHLASHLQSTCPLRSEPCPLQCGATLPIKMLKLHKVRAAE